MVSDSKNRPYAPAASVIEVLNRVRRRNLPETIDSPYVTSLGLSKEIGTRVLTALRFLRLIEDAGTPTESLQVLARSTDEEYRQILSGIISDAYADVFTSVHPEENTQAQIVNAFRRYEPGSQHYRMAVLFLGLCKEAGISVKDEPRKRETQGNKRTASPTTKSAVRKPAQRGQRNPPAEVVPAHASAVLFGYFKRLPAPGSLFSEAERQTWLDGMRAAFNFEYSEKTDMVDDDA